MSGRLKHRFSGDFLENRMIKRMLVFVDESNVAGAARIKNKNLDWLMLRKGLVKAIENVELVEMVIYVGLPPSTEDLKGQRESRERYVHWLRSNGFLVMTKNGSPKGGGSYKANVDVLMAMDCVELSLAISPDIVVLVTGDGDFASLATRLRRRGIKVYVCAIEETLGNLLRDAVNATLPMEQILDQMEDFEKRWN